MINSIEGLPDQKFNLFDLKAGLLHGLSNNLFGIQIGYHIKYHFQENVNIRFLNKQHFNKQYQAEIGRKKKRKVSNTLRLNFEKLSRIICFLLALHHPKI